MVFIRQKRHNIQLYCHQGSEVFRQLSGKLFTEVTLGHIKQSFVAVNDNPLIFSCIPFRRELGRRAYAIEAVRLFSAQTPKLRFQLGHASLCRQAFSSLLFDTSFGTSGTGFRFLVRPKIALRNRVEEPQHPVLPAHI